MAQIAILTLLFMPASLAAPPPEDVRRAEGLHAQAVKAWDRNRVEDAARLWAEAETLDPCWKYARNLAAAELEAKRWRETWSALDRAEAHGAPDSARQAWLVESRAKVRAQLQQRAAWVEVDVTPRGAVVTLGGVPVQVPYRGWIEGPESRLTASLAGHEAVDRVLEHPIGSDTREVIALVPLPVVGRLVVTGTPAGAEVRVDGRPIGALPRAEAGALTPGDHTVEVAATGHEAAVRSVVVVAGISATLEIALPATPIAAVTVVSAPRWSPAWKWVTLGVGVAAVAAGTGFLVHAALNRSPTREVSCAPGEDPCAAEVAAQRDLVSLEEAHQRDLTAGLGLALSGGVVAVAGVVLWALEGRSTSDE